MSQQNACNRSDLISSPTSSRVSDGKFIQRTMQVRTNDSPQCWSTAAKTNLRRKFIACLEKTIPTQHFLCEFSLSQFQILYSTELLYFLIRNRKLENQLESRKENGRVGTCACSVLLFGGACLCRVALRPKSIINPKCKKCNQLLHFVLQS